MLFECYDEVQYIPFLMKLLYKCVVKIT
jgi:hypothetical protein